MSDDGEFGARVLLAPEPTAAARARSFVRETLGDWDIALPESATDDAVLLTSELVANAVQHAGTSLEVGCRLAGDAVEVTVTDRHPSRTLPDELRPAGEDQLAERGRGLTLPGALASSWGVTYSGAAKTVWFRLSLPAKDPGSGPVQPDPAQPDAVQSDAVSPDAAVLDAVVPEVVVPEAVFSEPVSSEAVVPEAVVLTPGRKTGASGASGRDVPLEMPEPQIGKLRFEELVRHTVEAARDAVGADAAYALVADEEGELRVRGAVGVAVPDALTMPPATMLLSGGGVARSQMSVPFLVDGRVTGVLGVGSAAPGRFRDTDEVWLQEVADRAAMSLERLRLSELERVRRGRVGFLAEASELLSSTLDQRQAIALTAQLMVPRLAAWCAVFLVGEAGELRPAYVWHEDEAKIDALARLLGEIAPPGLTSGLPGVPGVGVPGAAGVVGLAAGIPGGPGGSPRGAQSWSLAVPPGAGLEDVRMASDSAWCFPLSARGRGLGAVVIGRPREDRRWQDPPPRESLELAEDLARRAALALDNARLYERQRMTSQALQHSLLPPELPEIPRIEFAAEYEAAGEANEVGGDFYDVFPVAHRDDGGDGGGGWRRWRFAIGDVCGTGPEAAAVTGLARHTLRILSAEGHAIEDVVERLNDLIIREGTRGRFITLLHGEIRVPGSSAEPIEVSLVCAGHPLPLLLRASSPPDELPVPAAEPQTLLGVVDDLPFEAQTVRLSPGDLLLCVTDGVTERRDDTGRLLDDDNGLARVLSGCRELSAWAVASRLRRAVHEFGTEASSDDMAILVMRAADAVLSLEMGSLELDAGA
ncbi:MAG TPA: SpoIIE family protein phosphatase [Trebonia sp.]|nr:SpoIIE family protein phosphatase [Trebonia sp.]